MGVVCSWAVKGWDWDLSRILVVLPKDLWS